MAHLAERAIKQLPLLILNTEIQRLFLLDNLDYRWPQEKNDKSVGLDSMDKIGIRTEEKFQLWYPRWMTAKINANILHLNCSCDSNCVIVFKCVSFSPIWAKSSRLSIPGDVLATGFRVGANKTRRPRRLSRPQNWIWYLHYIKERFLNMWLILEDCFLGPHFADHLLLNATLSHNWKWTGQLKVLRIEGALHSSALEVGYPMNFFAIS